MTFFDDQKLRMNVNVQGSFKEYADYKRRQRMNKRTFYGLLIWCGIAFGGIIMALGIHTIFYVPPAPSTPFHDLTELAVISTQMSWSSFAKFFLVIFMPVIAISWVIHGIQVRLLA